MKREWKPGDVAMVTTPSGREHIALRVGWPADDWISATEGGIYGASDIRPLVVIDPEDREQVRSLLVAILNQRDPLHPDASGIADALREFANPTPPKPAEPTGLGAVVEDAEGRIYTRYEKAGPKHEPQPWWQSANGPEHDVVRRFSWSDIAAVRVLSEGVTQ